MLKKLWKAKREIFTLIDDAAEAASDRELTPAEISKLTADVTAIVKALSAP